MRPLDALKLLEFEIRTSTESSDFDRVQRMAADLMRNGPVAPATLQEADALKRLYRHECSRAAARVMQPDLNFVG